MEPSDQESLIEFPCHYEIKVMGKDDENFHAEVRRIVLKHSPDADDSCFRQRPSSKGKYVSISASVYVETKGHLEAVYGDLRASEYVLYTL